MLIILLPQKDNVVFAQMATIGNKFYFILSSLGNWLNFVKGVNTSLYSQYSIFFEHQGEVLKLVTEAKEPYLEF